MSGKFLRGVLAAALLGPLSVSAADLSFTGNLPNDNGVQMFNFSVSTAATVTLRTWSYAGGTNAAGTVIPSGGFDPILAVFNATTGALIGANDDGGANVPPDPDTGVQYDTYLKLFGLPPGNYTVAVSQYANFARGPNLSNGFLGTSVVNFNGRTAAWAFDVLNVDAAQVVPQAQPTAVPALSEYALAALALGMVAAARRRRRAA